MRKRRNKILLTILLVMTLGFSSSISGFAAPKFTDVQDSHWAKKYIYKLADLGIIKGYEDATFRPEESVSKVAAVAMMYRMLEESGKIKKGEGVSLITKHQALLKSTGVQKYASWAQEPMAYVIEKGIVHPEEASLFFKDGKAVEAKRVEVAIFLAKALGADASSKVIVVLPYKDAFSITATASKYIQFLLERKIVSENGDGNGNFLPQTSVTRAALSKMISVGYDLLYVAKPPVVQKPANPTPAPAPTPEPPKVEAPAPQPPKEEVQPQPPVPAYTKKEGKLVFIGESELVLLHGDGVTKAYPVGQETKIFMGDTIVPLKNLELNRETLLYIDENQKLVEIRAQKFTADLEGTLGTLVAEGSQLQLKLLHEESKSIKSFTVKGDMKIELNGVMTPVDRMVSGDHLKLRVKNQEVLEIVGTTQPKTIEGSLLEKNQNTTGTNIKVQQGAKIIEVELTKDVLVLRNGQLANLEALKKGDKLTVTLTTTDKPLKVVAQGVFTKETGKVKEIKRAKETSLITLLINGNEKVYSIGNNIPLSKDQEVKSLYDLRLDHTLQLEFENGEVIGMKLLKEQINGTIKKLNTAESKITIEYMDPATQVLKVRDVLYIDKTKITSATLQTAILPKDLKTNAQIFVVGEEVDGVFTAETIVSN